MSDFKNMKILVENNFHEIVKELERLGYWLKVSGNMVFAWMGNGKQNILRMDKIPMGLYPLITLAELKEM